ncbi:RHS repeat protein [Butyrivibrio sp. X503]|uniref:DUF6531 domain-containing protein n=1 Tax=Butyrivibrio sp. X503 TaxID=2364878 RepID=UPI000EAA33C8|nr:DUF6531 domain-containing protein [Butyrivibrio sp. X503]RKM53921.1 RHS repeat protein [Butyrivibrio sp. X503]
MGKRYDSEKVNDFITDLDDSVRIYTSKSDIADTAYGRYIDNTTYIGLAADASKKFIKDVQVEFSTREHDIQKRLIQLYVAIDEHFKKTVDGSPVARIDTDQIKIIKNFFHELKEILNPNSVEIEGKAEYLKEAFKEFGSVTIPSYHKARNVYKEFSGSGEFLDKLVKKVEDFDLEACAMVDRSGLEQYIEQYIQTVVEEAALLDQMETFEPEMKESILSLIATKVGGALKELKDFTAKNATVGVMNAPIVAGLKKYLLGCASGCQSLFSDPVNVNNGNYINDREDLNITGIYPISLRRFYNAQSKECGFFGIGWMSLFDMHLSKENDSADANIRIVFSDGHEGIYQKINETSHIETDLSEIKETEYIEIHGQSGRLIESEDQYRLLQDDGSYTKFDKDGKLSSFGNSVSELARIEYEEGLPVGIRAGFKFIALDLDENGLITCASDNTGRNVKYEYIKINGEFLLTNVTYPDGTKRRYGYDDNGIINEVDNPRGITFLKNEYDDRDRVVKQSFPDGGVVSFDYDDEKLITTITEQNGLKTEYLNDEYGRHIGTRYPEQNISESFTYDEKNRKTSVTDKRGYTTKFSYDNRGHLTKVIDAKGNITNITYNAQGKPIVVKGPDGGTYKYSYDEHGQLVSVINPLMEENRLYYNEIGQVERIEDAEGASTHLDYDDNNDICYVKDDKGIETFYERDELGRVISTSNALGAKTCYEYDLMDRIIKVTDPIGNETRYSYNNSGKLIKVENPDNTAKTWEYNNIGKPCEYTDEAGRKTRITYNKVWDEETVKLPNGGTIRYEYDLLKRLVKVIDPEYRSTSYDYDENDNVIAQYNGDIKIKNLSYDALGNIIQETDALGNAKSYEYDANNNLIAVTDALGNKYTREVDPLGRVTKETDALGNSTIYTYTKLGDIESITDAAGRIRRFEYISGSLSAIYFCDRLEQKLSYDKLGRVISRTFADGYKIDYSYDVLDRIQSVEGSDGRSVSYEYDLMGRATKVSDGKNTTLYTYTPTGRLKSVVDALGNETAYTYDALDNLKSIHREEGRISDEERNGDIFPTVGKDGHVTIYDYDLSGQLTSVTDALGQKELFKYDQYGRLVTKTDRDNYATTYEYDKTGTVTKVNYSDGRTVAFSYNELRQLNKINDWLGETILENDILGRITKVTDYLNRTVAYEYGATGEKTKLTYPDGRVVSYNYDEKHQLKSVIGNGEETTYAYDELGRLSQKRFANGITQGYTYLPGGNLESMISSDKEGVLDKYFYSYDNTGLINGIERNRRGLDAVSGRYEYTYDPIGRLTSSTLNGQRKALYEYDAFGNRKSLTENDTKTSYSYDVLDRLTEAKELTNSQTNIKTYDYDNRGNQTKEFVNGLLQKTFTFDATNMLSKVVDTTKGELTNQYNGLGFRVSSTRPEERIEYLCDLSREYYNLLERTVNGEKESFVYDNNVISMSKKGNNYYYLQDELGSPMYMTGTDGIVSSYAFDDFGRNIDPFTGKQKKHAYATNGNIIQPFVFTGYQEDDISGLKFAQARYYSPDAGRFQSEDNVKGFVESPFTLNHYGYCWGNPIVLIDLDGNMPKWLEGIFAHIAIESDITVRYSSSDNTVHTNVFIEGGGAGRTKTGNGLADVVMKSKNIYSVYEIKPESQNPATNTVSTTNGLTLGEIQLAGYVKGINNNIRLGKSIGKFGSTSLNELAFNGTKIIPETVVYSPFIKNSAITYHSDGNGMVYYDVDKVPEEEYKHAMGIVKQESDIKEKVCKVASRVCYGTFGLVEMVGGISCFIPSSVLILDDGTVVGVLDDGVALGLYAAGTYLWLDGFHKVMKAITGCDN